MQGLVIVLSTFGLLALLGLTAGTKHESPPQRMEKAFDVCEAVDCVEA